MTPEQRFKRLRDPRRWTVQQLPGAEPVRRRQFAPVVATVVAVAAAAALVAAAITVGGMRPAPPAETDRPTSTPTATLYSCQGVDFAPAAIGADAVRGTALSPTGAEALAGREVPAIDPAEWYVLVDEADSVVLLRELPEQERAASVDRVTHELLSIALVDGEWLLDRAATCAVRIDLGDLGDADVALDPASITGSDARSVGLLVTERGCASGETAEGRIEVVSLRETAESIEFVIGVRAVDGDVNCPGNPPTSFALELDDPLGDRAVVDAALVPATVLAAADTPASAPEQLFDGDCSVPFPLEELSDAAGATVELGTTRLDTVHQVGGIYCSWTFPDVASNDSQSAAGELAIVPIELAVDRDDTTCGDAYTEGYAGDDVCTIEYGIGAFQLSGAVRAAAGSSATALATAVVTMAERALAGVQPPEPWAPDGVWELPDCAAIDGAIDASTIAGGPVELSRGGGTDVGPSPSVRSVNAAVMNACAWVPASGSDPAGMNVRVFPGGAWSADAIGATEGVEPTVIDGFDRAYRVPLLDWEGRVIGHTVHAFRGPNALSSYVSVDVDLDPASLLAAVADALD